MPENRNFTGCVTSSPVRRTSSPRTRSRNLEKCPFVFFAYRIVPSNVNIEFCFALGIPPPRHSKFELVHPTTGSDSRRGSLSIQRAERYPNVQCEATSSPRNSERCLKLVRWLRELSTISRSHYIPNMPLLALPTHSRFQVELAPARLSSRSLFRCLPLYT